MSTRIAELLSRKLPGKFPAQALVQCQEGPALQLPLPALRERGWTVRIVQQMRSDRLA